MQHLLPRNGYSSLMVRLSRFPQGAPPSELLARILALLFTEKEAELVSRLPMRPFSAATAAGLWGMREVEAFRLLEGLAGRALLLDAEREGEKIYLLPPPIAGFFDFSLMRVRSDLDQERLSELLYQYLNMEEEFITSLFVQGRTRLGRVLVDEDKIAPAHVTKIFNYERASEAIKGAKKIGLATCYCRHKMHHLGRACSAPMEMCMTFNTVADTLIRHGHAREIRQSECLDLLQQAREQNLVQMAENARDGVSFICNCCSCCCESLTAARRVSQLQPIHTSNFIATLRTDLCSGCGRCVDSCPVEAVSLVSANEAQHRWMRKCVPSPERCLGCGVCVRVCKSGAQSLAPREERVITPADSAHRVVLMAIESGKLQHLIWDNQVLSSHRAMAAVVGAILKLAPVKQALAQSQLASRYLHALIGKQVDLAKAPMHRYSSSRPREHHQAGQSAAE